MFSQAKKKMLGTANSGLNKVREIANVGPKKKLLNIAQQGFENLKIVVNGEDFNQRLSKINQADFPHPDIVTDCITPNRVMNKPLILRDCEQMTIDEVNFFRSQKKTDEITGLIEEDEFINPFDNKAIEKRDIQINQARITLIDDYVSDLEKIAAIEKQEKDLTITSQELLAEGIDEQELKALQAQTLHSIHSELAEAYLQFADKWKVIINDFEKDRVESEKEEQIAELKKPGEAILKSTYSQLMKQLPPVNSYEKFSLLRDHRHEIEAAKTKQPLVSAYISKAQQNGLACALEPSTTPAPGRR